MSLLIKVTNSDGYLMDEYMKHSKNQEYQLYCYFGEEGGAKPYARGQISDVFFIERDSNETKLYYAKIIDIICGPKHGGDLWDKKKSIEKQHIPHKYQDDLEDQKEIAFYIKFKDIKLISINFDYSKPLKKFYYQNSKNNPYIPSRARNAVSYVEFNGLLL